MIRLRGSVDNKIRKEDILAVLMGFGLLVVFGTIYHYLPKPDITPSPMQSWAINTAIFSFGLWCLYTLLRI